MIRVQTGTTSLHISKSLVPLGSSSQANLSYEQLIGDRRLMSAVRLDSEDMRLDDLAATLDARTRTRLAVAPHLAPRKISMRIVGRPLSAVMAALCSVVGASWRRIGDGYELYQTQDQIDREASLKRASAAREAAFVRSQVAVLRSTLANALMKDGESRAPLADFLAGCDSTAVEAGLASAVESYAGK